MTYEKIPGIFLSDDLNCVCDAVISVSDYFALISTPSHSARAFQRSAMLEGRVIARGGSVPTSPR